MYYNLKNSGGLEPPNSPSPIVTSPMWTGDSRRTIGRATDGPAGYSRFSSQQPPSNWTRTVSVSFLCFKLRHHRAFTIGAQVDFENESALWGIPGSATAGRTLHQRQCGAINGPHVGKPVSRALAQCCHCTAHAIPCLGLHLKITCAASQSGERSATRARVSTSRTSG